MTAGASIDEAAPKPVMKLAAALLQYTPGRPLTPDAVEFITMAALAGPSEIEAVLDIKMTPSARPRPRTWD